MCYFYSVNANKKAIEKAFNAQFIIDGFEPIIEANGFAHPYMPIILNSKPQEIIGANWGLIPSWAKDSNFAKNTLNARIETLDEKPSFKDNLNNRCLIPATNFYEWKWLDEKGKNKQKFSIFSQDQEIFAFAGLYSIWTNPLNNLKYTTYTIITQPANELMVNIHNTKKRMPLILDKKHQAEWLCNHLFENSSELIAFKI